MCISISPFSHFFRPFLMAAVSMDTAWHRQQGHGPRNLCSTLGWRQGPWCYMRDGLHSDRSSEGQALYNMLWRGFRFQQLPHHIVVPKHIWTSDSESLWEFLAAGRHASDNPCLLLPFPTLARVRQQSLFMATILTSPANLWHLWDFVFLGQKRDG